MTCHFVVLAAILHVTSPCQSRCCVLVSVEQKLHLTHEKTAEVGRQLNWDQTLSGLPFALGPDLMEAVIVSPPEFISLSS